MWHIFSSRPANSLSNIQNRPPPPRYGVPTSSSCSSSSSSYGGPLGYQPTVKQELPVQHTRHHYTPPAHPPPPSLSYTLTTPQQGPSKLPSWGKLEEDSPPNQPSRIRRPTHLLTATAQGIQHWSRFSTLTHLIFEVYGEQTVMVHAALW